MYRKSIKRKMLFLQLNVETEYLAKYKIYIYLYFNTLPPPVLNVSLQFLCGSHFSLFSLPLPLSPSPSPSLPLSLHLSLSLSLSFTLNLHKKPCKGGREGGIK